MFIYTMNTSVNNNSSFSTRVEDYNLQEIYEILTTLSKQEADEITKILEDKKNESENYANVLDNSSITIQPEKKVEKISRILSELTEEEREYIYQLQEDKIQQLKKKRF